MPGPNSEPIAARGSSVYSGKTNLKRAGLKSGEGMTWGKAYRRRIDRAAELDAIDAERRASHVSRH